MKTLLIFFSALLFASCCSQDNMIYEKKMDTPLKQKISEVTKEGSDEKIQIIGKCSQAITDEMKVSLEETGMTIESIVGDIFTAMGTKDQIIKISRIDYVSQLNLSITSKLLNK